MTILWITNGLLPEATAKLQEPAEIKGTGGWLLALANALMQTGEVDLTIASTSPLVKELTRVEGERIHYYAIPYVGDSVYKTEYENIYRIIYDQVQPDVTHIHGTEFPHSLAALRACGSERTVVSVQGLASVIARYYLAGLPSKSIWSHPSIHDTLRLSLIQQQREMEKRGQYEQQLLREASFVIGRTNWDSSHVWAVNPQIRYFHCDEMLRSEFYEGDNWSYERCKPHSIFLSQGSYPLKGLHKVLEALPLVKHRYPDVELRVAGQDITCEGTGIASHLKISTYGRIIRGLLKNKGIKDNVLFLGPLNAEQMKEEYLRANVFVCPSSIENSPNSLGEAQLLGTPCIASYAGGIPDFMCGNEEFLYRYEEVEMLSRKICEVFAREGQLSTKKMQARAEDRHNKNRIVKTIHQIYQEIAHQK